MLAGVYSRDRLTTFTKKLYPKKFFKPGYNWYYMGKSKLDRNCYFFFFRSWQIQQDLFKAYDPANPDAEFDIYLRIKLTGKNFIPGGSGSDAVWFDRLVLVKK